MVRSRGEHFRKMSTLLDESIANVNAEISADCLLILRRLYLLIFAVTLFGVSLVTFASNADKYVLTVIGLMFGAVGIATICIHILFASLNINEKNKFIRASSPGPIMRFGGGGADSGCGALPMRPHCLRLCVLMYLCAMIDDVGTTYILQFHGWKLARNTVHGLALRREQIKDALTCCGSPTIASGAAPVVGIWVNAS
jgi:hypothetical protein